MNGLFNEQIIRFHSFIILCGIKTPSEIPLTILSYFIGLHLCPARPCVVLHQCPLIFCEPLTCSSTLKHSTTHCTHHVSFMGVGEIKLKVHSHVTYIFVTYPSDIFTPKSHPEVLTKYSTVFCSK